MCTAMRNIIVECQNEAMKVSCLEKVLTQLFAEVQLEKTKLEDVCSESCSPDWQIKDTL